MVKTNSPYFISFFCIDYNDVYLNHIIVYYHRRLAGMNIIMKLWSDNYLWKGTTMHFFNQYDNILLFLGQYKSPHKNHKIIIE